MRSFAWTTSRLVSQHAGPLSRALYKAANLYVKTYNNVNYDMATNGENRVLSCLSQFKVKTVFDVGANKGDYAQACLVRIPSAHIHAFEIVPATFQKLVSNLKSSRVSLNNVGLSDKAGVLVINYNPDDDGSSSLVAGSDLHPGAWQQINVNVMKGDDYCLERGIEAIDLLKIDVEGGENLVLHGFLDTFRKGRIAAVQFEFGMVNVYSKFLLRDFWEFFEGHGFVLGPVMPKGVDFKAYDCRNENFQGPPNYVAVHASRPDLLKALRLNR